MRTGDALDQAIQQASERQNQSTQRTNFFKWQANEVKLLRFITDKNDVMVVFQHMIKLPQGWRTFTCKEELEEHCILCEHSYQRREVGLGVAILRQVEHGGSQISDFIQTGNDGVDRPYVGVLSQSINNFWRNINEVYPRLATENHPNGSFITADIEIKRMGGGQDTQYLPFPYQINEIPDLYERYKDYIPDIQDMVKNQGSDEYYHRMISGQNQNQENQPQTPHQQPPQQPQQPPQPQPQQPPQPQPQQPAPQPQQPPQQAQPQAPPQQPAPPQAPPQQPVQSQAQGDGTHAPFPDAQTAEANENLGQQQNEDRNSELRRLLGLNQGVVEQQGGQQ